MPSDSQQSGGGQLKDLKCLYRDDGNYCDPEYDSKGFIVPGTEVPRRHVTIAVKSLIEHPEKEGFVEDPTHTRDFGELTALMEDLDFAGAPPSEYESYELKTYFNPRPPRGSGELPPPKSTKVESLYLPDKNDEQVTSQTDSTRHTDVHSADTTSNKWKGKAKATHGYQSDPPASETIMPGSSIPKELDDAFLSDSGSEQERGGN